MQDLQSERHSLSQTAMLKLCIYFLLCPPIPLPHPSCHFICKFTLRMKNNKPQKLQMSVINIFTYSYLISFQSIDSFTVTTFSVG